MIYLQCLVAILLSQRIYRMANVTTITDTQVDQYYYLQFNVLLTVHHRYHYNETNVIHFSFNLLRFKGLYMFRALFVHPQEALHKQNLVYCVRMISVGCGPVTVKLQPCQFLYCLKSQSNLSLLGPVWIRSEVAFSCITPVTNCLSTKRIILELIGI
jgi:hypothetical protein